MNVLKDILYKTGILDVAGFTDTIITAVCFDSRKVREGSLFVAVRGTQTDGHEFIAAVHEKGASAIVCEQFPGRLLKCSLTSHIRFVSWSDSCPLVRLF